MTIETWDIIFIYIYLYILFKLSMFQSTEGLANGVKDVCLLLEMMEQFEKQLYNAYEGSAFSLPQPSKVLLCACVLCLMDVFLVIWNRTLVV